MLAIRKYFHRVGASKAKPEVGPKPNDGQPAIGLGPRSITIPGKLHSIISSLAYPSIKARGSPSYSLPPLAEDALADLNHTDNVGAATTATSADIIGNPGTSTEVDSGEDSGITAGETGRSIQNTVMSKLGEHWARSSFFCATYLPSILQSANYNEMVSISPVCVPYHRPIGH